ncbi:hypothetical protein EV121DRAFT_194378 [Schizophyllum commune]
MSGRGIFTKEDGRPVVFFLHKTIKGDKRILLREEIQKHGGQVTDDDDEAETVLIDDYALKPAVLQLRYAMRPINPRVHDFWVEPLTFVRKCINWGVYSHEARKVGMPGRAGNEEGLFRVEFTADDDEHLVQFLATHLPEKSAGGRTGLEPYRRLVDLYDESDPDTWRLKWVRRHTEQSWRERYRKNQARLDPLIDAIARREDPPDAVTYERNRMYKQGNRKQIYVQGEEGEDEEGEVEVEEDQSQQEQDYEEEDEIREFSPTQVEYQTAPDKTLDNADEEDQLEEDQYEYEQPASQVAGQKRRHSDGDALLAQRQRWDKRPRLTGSQLKGKQRAVEPVDDVYEEPRPPSPTLVDRRQSQIYPPLPEDTPQPSPRESASPAHIPGRYTPSPSTQPLPSLDSRLAASRLEQSPVRNLAAARPSRPLVPVSTASQSQPAASQSQSVARQTRTAASRNQSAARTRIKPRRAPVIPAVAEDAPARNTRARSRGLSTEPSPPPTQKSPQPNRKQRERRHVPGSSQSEDEDHMPTVREEELENPFAQDAGDDDEQPPVEVEEDDSREDDEFVWDEDEQPPAETLEDEDAVVHQLMDNSALSAGGVDAETYDEDAENRDPRLEHAGRGEESVEDVDEDGDDRERHSDDSEELSSDDAQTREHISFQAPASPVSAPPSRSTNVFLPKVPPQVRRLARGTQPASQSLPLPQTPAPGNTSRSLRTSLAADLLSLSMQRSPPRHRGLSSESSVESYPLPNTRASTEKQRLTQEQMQSPYVPAQGTRAARLLRSRLRAQEAA